MNKSIIITSEKRYSDFNQSKEGIVSGYCLLWDKESFIPQINKKEKFLKGSVKLRNDGVPCLFEHDRTNPLGHSKSGTLILKEDHKGLHYQVKLPKSATKERELLDRGDITGASISFVPLEEHYRTAGCRTIEQALIQELSLTTNPAHEGTLNYRCKQYKQKRRKWGEVLWTYPV